MFQFIYNRQPQNPYTKLMASNLLLTSIFCLLFGIAILLNPDLIAYLVALFLIAVGAVLLAIWWRMRQ